VIDDFAKGGVNGVHGLLTGDINRDGTLDLIGNSAQPNGSFPNSLAWWDGKTFERHIFAKNDAPGLSHYFGFGDVNGDGRGDIAVGAKIEPDGNYFAWWEQPGDAAKPWTKHVINAQQPGATNIAIVDVNKDGKMDFLATRGHGRGLVWFEAPNWTPHSINDTIIGPHALATGDIDKDGDIDAVTCAKDSLLAAWFENDGKGGFTTHPIYEVQSCYDIRLVDIDKDGKLDVLVAGRETGDVVWYRNQLKGK
ncbi:MAG TPA: VCBS repeat-containing protein, partial [Bryobacteraceae bacterium]|nr:VCBS repeat-containing protein [Bryobacteraceae bacterium]